MPWQDDLQPASWRGVPFGVDLADFQAGRNTAVHAYPERENNPVWVEDLGLSSRDTRIVGYLTGDDVAAQQNVMIAAVEAAGPGELVHPMLGSMVGSIVGKARFLLRKDKGRYIEVVFGFIAHAPGSPYPTTQPDTQAGVSGAADDAQRAAGYDYAKRMGILDASSVTAGATLDAGSIAQPGLA